MHFSRGEVKMNILTIVLSLAALLCAADAVNHRQLLEQICRLDESAAQLTQLSDFGILIQVLKSDPTVRCPLRVAQTILELEPILAQRSVCSEQSADFIVDYWSKYISEQSELSHNLHPTLRTIFIAYGLQASKLCKITLMHELPKAIHLMRITEQDVHMVTNSILGNRKLQKVFGEEPRLEDLLIVVRTDSCKNDAEAEISRISMPPREMRYFELMREKCACKFKPVYDTLISPIVRLASIGLNYKEKTLLNSLEIFRAHRIYKDWFNVVIACEAIVKHEPITIPASSLHALGNTARITVLDPDDMAELQAKTGLAVASASASASASGSGSASAAAAAAAAAATSGSASYHEPSDYEVIIRMYDQVINPSDAYLLRSIDRYGRGLEEMTKLRLRLIKRLPSLIKLVFKCKEVQFGLTPMEEHHKLHRRMSRKTKKRLTVIGLGLLMMTGVAISSAGLAVLAFPLAKVWLAVGGCIIFIILIGMIFGVVFARE